MTGEKNLQQLLQKMAPQLNTGEYVFTLVHDLDSVDRQLTIAEFKEREGTTMVLERSKADALGLHYTFVARWITLEVHSALEAVGLTASFSTALAQAGISCNVIAGYHHDHIFVPTYDADKAMKVLDTLAQKGLGL